MVPVLQRARDENPPVTIDLTVLTRGEQSARNSSSPLPATKALSKSVPLLNFDEADNTVFKERLSYLKEWVTARDKVGQAGCQARSDGGTPYKHFHFR